MFPFNARLGFLPRHCTHLNERLRCQCTSFKLYNTLALKKEPEACQGTVLSLSTLMKCYMILSTQQFGKNNFVLQQHIFNALNCDHTYVWDEGCVRLTYEEIKSWSVDKSYDLRVFFRHTVNAAKDKTKKKTKKPSNLCSWYLATPEGLA